MLFLAIDVSMPLKFCAKCLFSVFALRLRAFKAVRLIFSQTFQSFTLLSNKGCFYAYPIKLSRIRTSRMPCLASCPSKNISASRIPFELAEQLGFIGKGFAAMLYFQIIGKSEDILSLSNTRK